LQSRICKGTRGEPRIKEGVDTKKLVLKSEGKIGCPAKKSSYRNHSLVGGRISRKSGKVGVSPGANVRGGVSDWRKGLKKDSFDGGLGSISSSEGVG